VSWRGRLVEGLHSAYGVANRLGVLDNRVLGDLFVRTYFGYKRLGDPFAMLSERRPDLFRGGHILDVGANVGYTAALFARVVDPGFRVFAFEPERKNFERLVRTMRRLHVNDRVEPIRAAVGAGEGAVELWSNVRHHAGHRVITDAFRTKHAGAHTESVPLLSLDHWAHDRGIERAVRFVKIDVEGYETAVCEGMAGIVRNNPGLTLAIEYAPEPMRELGFAPQAVLEFLMVHGFAVDAIDPQGNIEPFDSAQPEQHLGARGYVDLLCTRKQRSASRGSPTGASGP
jgi:FkbM family methyltransferase